jgi:methionyl-tRNA synthetase
MLSFAYKRFDGKVPEPGVLDDEDRALLEKVEAGFETVGALYNTCKFRAAPGEALALAPGSRSCQATAKLTRSVTPGPCACSCEATAKLWTSLSVQSRHPARRGQPEDDPGADPAAHACANAQARAVHGTQKLHECLGYDGQLFGTQHVVEYQEETRSHRALTYDHTGAIGTWTKSALPLGQALREPAPLFKKLDESLIEEEYARLAE